MRHRDKFEHIDGFDSEGTWAISYGDLLTLITSFFIMFFTADKFQKQKYANQVPLELGSHRTFFNEFLYQQLREVLMKDIKTKIEKDGQRLVIEFLGTSFFKSAKTQITNYGLEKLNEFLKIYEPYVGQYRVSITAFSDSRPLTIETRKKYDDNLQLSALRALEVVRYLQKKGVPLRNMRIQGFGELVINPDILEAADALKLERLPAQEKKDLLYDLARTIQIVIEPKEAL